MANLPGSHGRGGFTNNPGGFRGGNTGPFGSPSPGTFGAQNTGSFGTPGTGPGGGQNVGPFRRQTPGQCYGPQGPGQYEPPSNLGQGPYPPQGYPPQGYPQQGYPPQGYPPQGYPPQGYPPQGYPPQGYPPQGYPPQGYPGYPQRQMYPGRGYPQQGHRGGFGRLGSPGAGLGQAACCGSIMACLTCLFCSCSPCIMGAGRAGMRSEDGAAEDGHEVPETADVSSPMENQEH